MPDSLECGPDLTCALSVDVNSTAQTDLFAYNTLISQFRGINAAQYTGLDLAPTSVQYSPSNLGFALSDPLVVDVIGGTPESSPVPLPGLVFDQTKTGEIQRMADFVPISPTEGIDFPSARPTNLLDLFNTGLGLVSNLVSTPQTLPNTQVMQVNTNTAVCPPSRLGHRQHLTKPRKGVPQHCAPNRHMNSLNPHALRRATRRLKGFMGHVKSAEKTIRQALGHTITSPHRRPARSRTGCVTCGRSARSCVC